MDGLSPLSSSAIRVPPRVLALTSPGGFSGLPDAVLRELAHYCEIVASIDGLRMPVRVRALTVLRTFYPRRREWGRRYYAALGRYTKRPRGLLARIRYCERQLVRLHESYDLIYQFGALFGALERPSKAPLILHIDFTTRLAEEYYPAWLPGSRADTDEWNCIEASIYRTADLIFVPTQLVAASLSDHYGVNPDKIAVVGMGAHIDDLTGDFDKPQSRVLVFAAPDFERHGGELTLEIFEGVRQVCPDATLTTVTNRSVDAPGVRNVGIVPRARLHGILREAAVLLVPGSVGGYQTVTEGMAAKCLCVVAEKNPHMSGLVRNGETGITIDPARPAQASCALAGYLQRPCRLSAIGEDARRHVVEECSWPKVAARIWREIGARLSYLVPNEL